MKQHIATDLFSCSIVTMSSSVTSQWTCSAVVLCPCHLLWHRNGLVQLWYCVHVIFCDIATDSFSCGIVSMSSSVTSQRTRSAVVLCPRHLLWHHNGLVQLWYCVHVIFCDITTDLYSCGIVSTSSSVTSQRTCTAVVLCPRHLLWHHNGLVQLWYCVHVIFCDITTDLYSCGTVSTSSSVTSQRTCTAVELCPRHLLWHRNGLVQLWYCVHVIFCDITTDLYSCGTVSTSSSVTSQRTCTAVELCPRHLLWHTTDLFSCGIVSTSSSVTYNGLVQLWSRVHVIFCDIHRTCSAVESCAIHLLWHHDGLVQLWYCVDVINVSEKSVQNIMYTHYFPTDGQVRLKLFL